MEQNPIRVAITLVKFEFIVTITHLVSNYGLFALFWLVLFSFFYLLLTALLLDLVPHHGRR